MGGGMGSMLYIIMLVAVFWFLLIRPQQAQAKKRAEMLTALKTGDKVVTIGGICGKVAQITDNKIFVEVSDGIVVEFLRNAISTVEVEEELKIHLMKTKRKTSKIWMTNTTTTMKM